MNIGFIPTSFFEEAEFAALDIQLGTTPDAFLQSIMPMLRLTGDNTEGALVSEDELISLGDERHAGLLIISDAQREGMFIVFAAADGVIAFVSAAGYPGELDGFQDIAFTVAATLEHSGSVDALIAEFYGS